MNKSIEITQKQMLRGDIFGLCNELGNMGAGVPLLLAARKDLYPSCKKEDIASSCHYLHGKGFIDFKNVRSTELNLESDIAYITSTGVDFLEGTTPINGIILR